MKLLSMFTFLLFTTAIPALHSMRLAPISVMAQVASQPEELSLLQFLNELGKSCECYFTLEEAWQNNEPINQVESVRISKAALKVTPQNTLELLRQQVPNLSYMIDNHNPRIVHLIDTRLLHQRGYALESIIKQVNFEGTSGELVEELKKYGSQIQLPSVLGVHEARQLKSDARMKAIGRALKAREVLSSFSSLENHGRILWIARTKLSDNEITNIYLYR
ncbi:MAG: hypothetical protein HYR56_09210 [Acidobacteria bacterium]|nr:hypothetical protein [Acidobacteriota bacterium]